MSSQRTTLKRSWMRVQTQNRRRTEPSQPSTDPRFSFPFNSGGRHLTPMAAGPDQSASAGRFRRGAASTDHHVIITPPDASPRRIFRLAKSGPLRKDRPRVRDSLQTACGVQKPRRRDRACPRAAAAWPRVTARATAGPRSPPVRVPCPCPCPCPFGACCELSWAKPLDT